MNVKAQGLLNGAAFVRERFGADGLERVLAACRPELRVRERLATSNAIHWIPQAELGELLGAADRVLGIGDGKMAEAIGAASARRNLRHMALRLAFFVARPEFLMRRVAGVWRQFNEHGEMLVRSFQDGRMTAELVGVPDPNAMVCCSVTGWLYEAGVATGMRDLIAEHTECRGRGGARCLWSLRWSHGRAAR